MGRAYYILEYMYIHIHTHTITMDKRSWIGKRVRIYNLRGCEKGREFERRVLKEGRDGKNSRKWKI